MLANVGESNFVNETQWLISLKYVPCGLIDQKVIFDLDKGLALSRQKVII